MPCGRLRDVPLLYESTISRLKSPIQNKIDRALTYFLLDRKCQRSIALGIGTGVAFGPSAFASLPKS
jgi:hypothetical protein